MVPSAKAEEKEQDFIMNLLKRARLWAAGVALKAANLSFVPQWVRSSFMYPLFWNLVRYGYKENATVFACVSVLARTFPEPELWPWAIEKGQENKPDNHALRQLLKKPNPDMGEAELWSFVVNYCSIGGNAYLWKRRDNGGRVIELWPFHDGHMQPIPGRNSEEGLVAYYVLDIGDGQSHNPYSVARFDGLPGVAIPKTEIVHWKWMIDPEQPWRGIGALSAAFGDLNVANEIRSYVYSLLKNDAKPPIVITLVEGDEYDPDTVERIREDWVQKYGGNNRGIPAFLESGMGVQELGFSLQQLEIDKLRNGPDAAICMGFGINPVVVGALVGLEHSTYANYEEASKALTLQTLVPLWRAFGSEMTQSFEEEPGFEQDVIRFDLDMVRALDENQNELREFALNAFNAAGITRSEFRQMVNLPVRAGDDVYKVAINVMFEPAGNAQPVKALPDVLPKNTIYKYENGEKRPFPRNGDMVTITGVADKVNGRYRVENGELVPEETTKTGVKVATDYKDFPTGTGGASSERADDDLIKQQQASIDALRQLRAQLEQGFADDLGAAFKAWADRVEFSGDEPITEAQMDAILKGLVDETAVSDLTNTLDRWILETSAQSWEFINGLTGVDLTFSENDPAVVRALARSAGQVKNITDTTKTAVQQLLQDGYENGWSIDMIARGDPEFGVRGIADVVAETYRGRPETIARTEIGTAQNTTTHARYEAAGFTHVIVFDNGFDNSHETCRQLAGTKQTLKWAKENPLQHPNCVRAFGPYFED
jgi:HK97 family phage portal protein